MARKRKPTQNQIEYAKQIRNLKRRIRTAEKAGYYFGLNQIIPDRPDKIRKKDIQSVYNIRGDVLYSQAERQWGYERPQTRKERLQQSAKLAQSTRYLTSRLRDKLQNEYGYARADLRKMTLPELQKREETEDTAAYYREQQYWDEYDAERSATISKLVRDYNYSESKIRDYSLYDLDQLPKEWQVSEQEKPYREALVKAIIEYADYIPVTLTEQDIKRMSTENLETLFNSYVDENIPITYDETVLNTIEQELDSFVVQNDKQKQQKELLESAINSAIERYGREQVANNLNNAGTATEIIGRVLEGVKYENEMSQEDANFSWFYDIMAGHALSMEEAEELESDYGY